MILPEKNRRDIDEIPQDVAKELRLFFVSKVEEVLELALESKVDETFLKEENVSLFKAKL